MKRSGFFSLGKAIARAFTCAMLIVIVLNPALVSASTYSKVGSAHASQGVQTAMLVQSASVQKQNSKTVPARCKGRLCLEPAVYESGLPEALHTSDWNSYAQFEDQGLSGFIAGINTPPPKHLVSGT